MLVHGVRSGIMASLTITPPERYVIKPGMETGNETKRNEMKPAFSQ